MARPKPNVDLDEAIDRYDRSLGVPDSVKIDKPDDEPDEPWPMPLPGDTATGPKRPKTRLGRI